MLEQLGVPLETGVAALQAFAPLSGRGAVRVLETHVGSFTLIDESYNANPLSMAQRCATLAQPARDRPPHRGADRHA